MKNILALVMGAAVASLLTGCETPLPPGAEPGPHGTMAYNVPVEASEPGARIEVNGEVVGNTPITIKIFGDRDGTFHDFGSYYYVVRALPVVSNQFPQMRVFGTGRGFNHEDRIPDRISFDMSQNNPPPPPAGAPYYPYPYPYPAPGYYPYYPYYGPSVRFYFGPGGYYHHYHHW
jgi:hypothetical protein